MRPRRSGQRAALLGLVLLGGCGRGEPSGAGAVPRSALLVTLDTTRQDAVEAFGAPTGTTPNLARLASESVAYRWARSVTPVTLPAHASMLTGLYPIRHGVRDNGLVALPDEATTLAERARAAGFETAAFVAAAVLERRFGLDQGFDVYDEPTAAASPGSVHYASRPAREVVAAAERWLEARERPRPFFAWVHLFDPHLPYDVTPEQVARAGGDPYLAEVHAMDAALGELFDALRAHGLAESTWVVVVGDHGEGRGEHDEPTHGDLCYDSTLLVPLFVRHPDGGRAGERSDETVSVVDLFPTLLEALDLGAPGDVDGHSLLAPLPPERGVYFESYYGYLHYGWSPVTGWAERGGKYLHSAAPELYDPRADPGERQDLAAQGRPLERYREAIAALAARPRFAPSRRTLDPELAARLASLGYASAAGGVDALPEPLAETDRPSPAARRDEAARFEGALALAEGGDPARAATELAALAEANPRNVSAHEHLAQCLLQLRRFDEALPVLRRVLALGVERVETHVNLADCLHAAGDDRAALRHLERALELDPGHAVARRNRAFLERALGEEAPRAPR